VFAVRLTLRVFAAINPKLKTFCMDVEKLQSFQAILLEQRRRHLEKVSAAEEANVFVSSVDDLKDQLDLAQQDVNKHIAYHLTERERFMIAAIDKVLERIEDGEYGLCARCEEPIAERRLEIIPTALYCAPCQTAIESNGYHDED
jgi:DnaK suppressor protein